MSRRGAAGKLLPALLVVCALAVGPSPALAAGPRLVLDRAEAEPSWFPGLARLRLFVTAVALEGGAIPLGDGHDVGLLIGGGKRRESPLVGHFAGTGAPLAVALVVEVGYAYRDDLPHVIEALTTLVDGLPDDAQVSLVSYGESVDGGRRFESPAQAIRRLAELEADDGPSPPELLEAVDRAALGLGKLAAPEGQALRRVMVIASDGHDAEPEPDRYRASGKRARGHDIRIHSLAYSPIDDRRPLRGLGELSKQAGGTFRWIRSREGFAPQIETLLDELGRQYVLTFFVPPDALLGKRVEVAFQALRSEPLLVTELACGAVICADDEYCAARTCHARAGGRGLLGWLLFPAIGLAALALVALVLRGRRRPRAAAPPPPGAFRPVPARSTPPPADHRIAPILPGARPAAPAAPRVPGPARPASLMVLSGVLAGRSFPLRHGFTIGTAITSDLVLSADRFASANHAQIVLDTAGNYLLVDRGSSNGTFVSGVRVRDVVLTHGVAIKLGQTELRFVVG